MFLILLGGSLTFGAALLATVIYTDGALVALRTAAEIIGWLLLLATVAGLVGMRRASPGPLCAASVTLCSGLAALYMSYFFEWHEVPRAPMRLAAAESFYVRAVPVAYKVIEPVMRPAEVAEVVKVLSRGASLQRQHGRSSWRPMPAPRSPAWSRCSATAAPTSSALPGWLVTRACASSIAKPSSATSAPARRRFPRRIPDDHRPAHALDLLACGDRQRLSILFLRRCFPGAAKAFAADRVHRLDGLAALK